MNKYKTSNLLSRLRGVHCRGRNVGNPFVIPKWFISSTTFSPWYHSKWSCGWTKSTSHQFVAGLSHHLLDFIHPHLVHDFVPLFSTPVAQTKTPTCTMTFSTSWSVSSWPLGIGLSRVRVILGHEGPFGCLQNPSNRFARFCRQTEPHSDSNLAFASVFQHA